jgi:N-acetylmuramoyl-L-alanine amidase
MILRRGSRGSQVRELQELLKLKVDGIFGPGTELVVIEFQKKNGLKSDGVVGPKTWEVLLSKKEVKVVPVYTTTSKSEDFDDPEEEMPVDITIRENLPTCKNTIELINLINNAKITRSVKRLVFHCTATQQTATVASIEKYWRDTLKWKSPGYHIIVKPDGSWTQLSDFNNPTNGVAGINSNSLHVSYIGGIDKTGKAIDNRTDDQSRIFEAIYHTFKNKMPNLTFHGHYEFSKKACPCYNVENWIKAIQE